MAKKEFNFIDLFAGCGGLSEGFYKQGYRALAHVEIDHFACETLKTRMRHYGYKNADTAVLETDITSKDIVKRISDVVGDNCCRHYYRRPSVSELFSFGKS